MKLEEIDNLKLRNAVIREIKPGEQILWMDKPIRSFFRSGNLMFTMLALLGILILATGILPFLDGHYRWPMPLTLGLIAGGVLLLSFCIYNCTCPFATLYIITNKRAIACKPSWRRFVITDHPIQAFTFICRSEDRGGVGNITVGLPNVVQYRKSPSDEEITLFANIANVRHVEILLKSPCTKPIDNSPSPATEHSLPDNKISEPLCNLLKRELDPAEKVLWLDRPGPRYFTTDSTIAFIAAIPWNSFLIVMAILTDYHLPWFMLFHAACGILLLSYPLLAYRFDLRTLYAITDKRVIIINIILNTTYTCSLTPDSLQKIQFKERRNGRGNFILRYRWTRQSDSQSHAIGFYCVKNPREVNSMLMNLAVLQTASECRETQRQELRQQRRNDSPR